MIADFTPNSTGIHGTIKGASGALPGVETGSPVRVEMNAQPTNPTITRVAAHLSRRAAKPYRVRSPFRRMLLQKLHPRRNRSNLIHFYRWEVM